MEKILFRSLLISTILFTSSAGAFATVPTSAEPQQIEKNFEQKRQLTRPEEVSTQGQDVATDESIDKTKMFTLSKINFTGNTVYSAEELNAAVAESFGQKVSLYDLNKAANAITKKYRDAGYILSRAKLNEQKVKDGTVTIDVIEGYFSEVNLGGDTKHAEFIKRFAEKLSNIKPVNRKDIERYMLLIDDLPGVKARSVITPSTKVPGTSSLMINLEQKKYEPSISVDNFGTRFVGPYQVTGVVAANSLFGAFDRTTVRGITTLNDELAYGEVVHEQQVGSEGTKLRARAAQTTTNPGGRLDSLEIHGESTVLDLNLSTPYIRTRSENLYLQGGFKANNSITDVSSTNIADDRVRVLYTGATLEFSDKYSTSNLLDVKYSHGVPAFDETADGVGRSRANGKHQFNKIEAEFTRLQNIATNLDIFTSVYGQFSDNPLLASEEVGAGGRKYGRGYDPAEITGDSGFEGQIEFRYYDLATSAITSNILQNVQYYAFYDGASLFNKDTVVGEASKQTLASTGIGVRFNLNKDLTGDLSVSAPLTRKVNAEGDDSKSPRAFLSLTKRF